ncbi:MAG TPA: HD domain-containing protein [Myxococcota bacterium]|nr:HD domain-containing protein [Myxococcota bacterium]
MPSTTLPSQRPAIELRDPVHGAIPVRSGELAVIDTPLFQRLRGVRQLGFGEHVFPGAVHHRYLHSIGAMHVAGQVMRRLIEPLVPDGANRDRLIQLARLAALLHDVGHPPLSHAAESLLPLRRDLLGADVEDPDEVASHEDMTFVILTSGELSDTLTRAFSDLGITGHHVADLIAMRHPRAPGFTAEGIDFGPLLHQLVSGELDVDRMDYLLRDSYFTGVRYGTYDYAWLVSNVEAIVIDGVARLAVDMRALPAFEHFLLARYHMFQMVYYHPISDAYDATLRRYLGSVGPDARLPADLSTFTTCTDAWLRDRLERSRDAWADRVITRRPFTLIAELRTPEEQTALKPLITEALSAAGLDLHWHSAKPVLSRYAVSPVAHRKDPLLVVDHRPPVGKGPRVRKIEEVTDLFDRYERVLRIERAYVVPEDKRRARDILKSLA